MAMSWQAALFTVIMLILEFRTEKKGNETMAFLSSVLVVAFGKFCLFCFVFFCLFSHVPARSSGLHRGLIEHGLW